MSRITPAILLSLAATLPASLSAADAVKADFSKHIKPILEAACIHCHSTKSSKGELNLETKELAIKGGDNGTALVPGDPSKSPLYTTLILGADEDEVMPPAKEGLLAKSQIALIEDWIKQGAPWPEGIVLEQQTRVDFVKHIQPIFEQNCMSCHNPEKSKGDFIMASFKETLETGENAPNLVPFDVEKSPVYTLCALDKDDDELMPPVKSGGPLAKSDLNLIKLWVEQGAVWPDGITLKAKEKASTSTPTPDTIDLVKRIHSFIVQTTEKEKAELAKYTGKIPKTGIPYTMVPIKGGEFMLGSPPTEALRGDDEGPQVKVKISPFWMGEKEVTWDEYQPFMITAVDRQKDGAPKTFKETDKIDDLVSQPTTPYTEMSFGMGTDGFPAISMTHHAANKYCQWLSAQTGHFYRLPTEAEWEYAARAGSTTAYFWGDDESKLADYAWTFDNAPNYQYAKVGQKKPSPWGLYDIYGNVVEWCLDQYDENGYKALSGVAMKDGILDGSKWLPTTKAYPHVVRGGSFDDDPDMARSAFRRGSDPEWKNQDPQLPKSIWYHTDTKWLGFRIVRPQVIPSAEEMFKAWNNGFPKD
jgi:formylglycine-generating enzyme required for sulfatase activity